MLMIDECFSFVFLLLVFSIRRDENANPVHRSFYGIRNLDFHAAKDLETGPTLLERGKRGSRCCRRLISIANISLTCCVRLAVLKGLDAENVLPICFIFQIDSLETLEQRRELCVVGKCHWHLLAVTGNYSDGFLLCHGQLFFVTIESTSANEAVELQ